MATLLLQAAAGIAVSYGLSVLNAALSPDQFTTNEGPRMRQSQVTFATEGDPIPRHWGWNRLGGNIIWSTRFKETKVVNTQDNGGKGVQNKSTVETVTYSYSCSFAVAFCEGNDRTRLGRVWADGKLLDLTSLNYRFYPGSETQTPDTFIQTVEGSATVPAYRGVAYIVFEDLQIADFGNRIPVITAEIIKGPKDITAEDLESRLRGVQLIPGAGEFVYGTRRYVATDGRGNSSSQNVHNVRGVPNVVASLDVLEQSAPEVDTVGVVVSWFGDDLRAGVCTLRPKVETTSSKNVTPADWAAGGLASRDLAQQVSYNDEGRANFGGTPADITVREIIAELKSRGKRVVFYPFIMMDIPEDNALPNPYGGTGQPAFPWRGRITCTPAPGQPGTPDKTATAATQMAAFVGAAAPADFGAWNGQTIPYSGPAEWSYRRMILHYAKLTADLLGTDDVFIIGAEMVGASTVRSSASAFPFVTALGTLAGDAAGMLAGGVKMTYAADWSEYHSYRPADGSGDVYFHLDPLWANSNIDFIGIDNYLPASDWRDGTGHLDYAAGYRSIYETDYLRANIEGGELFDWYYADMTARENQTRTPITDATYGEPWVFGNKNMRGWWANAHHNRPGGVRSGSATAWTPQSKPIWFTEFGCPAVDKGSNQPNVFYDPKSAESAFPYFSAATPDSLIQRRYLEETIGYWVDNAPVSGVYGGPMVAAANMLAWCWDARPFPEYPSRVDIWGDGTAWTFGHWLNGRLPLSPLAGLVREVCAPVGIGIDDLSVEKLYDASSVMRGFTVLSLASPREIIEGLGNAFFFDGFASQGIINFAFRQYAEIYEIDIDDLVLTGDLAGGYELVRGQETELPGVAKVTFWDEASDYQLATVGHERQVGQSVNTISTELPMVIADQVARAIPTKQIQEAWTGRERGKLALPPSMVKYNPGDVLNIVIKGRSFSLRIEGFDSGEYREASVRGFDIANYGALEYQPRQSSVPVNPFYGPSVFAFLQIPLMTGEEPRPWAPRVVAYQSPWPGGVAVYRPDGSGGWLLDTSVPARSPIGALTQPLFDAGRPDCWDRANVVELELYSDDQILAATEEAVLNGANLLAVENADGEWEVLQFVNAQLIAPKTYRLSQLLRARGGTEYAMRSPVAAGARVVLLSQAVPAVVSAPLSDIFQNVTYRVGPASVDVSDFRYQEVQVPIAAAGLKPFAPAHVGPLIGGRIANDWHLTWVRRTRFGGDSWEPESVPLNEESERYDLEILDGATVVRTVTGLASPDFIYTSAMQTADFGGVQDEVSYRVYQISTIYGRGSPGSGTAYL